MGRYEVALGHEPPKIEVPEAPLIEDVEEHKAIEPPPTDENVVTRMPSLTTAAHSATRRSWRRNPTIRIVWANGLNDAELAMLRVEVERSIADPDYIIIANYQIHWEEIRVNTNRNTRRIVWADLINPFEIGNLQEQVDRAIEDPEFTIVTNYQVHWEEIPPPAQQRRRQPRRQPSYPVGAPR